MEEEIEVSFLLFFLFLSLSRHFFFFSLFPFFNQTSASTAALVYSLRSLTLSEWTISVEGPARDEEEEEDEEVEFDFFFATSAAAAVFAAQPTSENDVGSLGAAGELDAEECSPALVGLLLLLPSCFFAAPTTNTEHGDRGSLGGVEGGDDDRGDEEEGDDGEGEEGGNAGDCGGATSGLAGVVGAEWTTAAGLAPAASRVPSPSPPLTRLFTRAAPAIALARLGVVVEEADTDEGEKAMLLLFFFFASAFFAFLFSSLPFFIPPAPLSAPSGPKNLAWMTSE